jgi:hypothetical protein
LLATLNTDALYKALERRLHDEKRSWRWLAGELDLQPSTFTRMKSGKQPSVDAFLAMLCWLGESHRAFTLGAPITQLIPAKPAFDPALVDAVAFHVLQQLTASFERLNERESKAS